MKGSPRLRIPRRTEWWVEVDPEALLSDPGDFLPGSLANPGRGTVRVRPRPRGHALNVPAYEVQIVDAVCDHRRDLVVLQLRGSEDVGVVLRLAGLLV